jgi:hypothetical protein
MSGKRKTKVFFDLDIISKGSPYTEDGLAFD